jgi:trans-2,3-dihydro-3-hydroxyanthranilate isomerase
MSRFVTLDVFTTRRFAGNPLAVFPDAQGMDPAQFQAIAREIAYSETAFLLPPVDRANSARLRIFTPAEELPFAGHPNVGTAMLLAREGLAWGEPAADRFRFEEGAGLVAIEVVREDGAAKEARVRAPSRLALGSERERSVAARMAGLAAGDIIGTPVYASVGTGFLFAEVGLTALARARPLREAFLAEAGRLENERLNREGLNREGPGPAGGIVLPSLFLYARSGGSATTLDLEARMFAPLSGIEEDPATGSAAAALGALLHRREQVTALSIVQGRDMGRRSDLRVEAGPEGVILVGAAVPVFEGRLLP